MHKKENLSDYYLNSFYIKGMGIFKFTIVFLLSVLSFSVFAKISDKLLTNENEKRDKNQTFQIVSISEGACEVDEFGRSLCVPPAGVFTLYRLRFSKDLTKIVVQSIFTDELIKPPSLVNLESTAKLDIDNVYWVIKEKDLYTKIVVGMIYRETYKMKPKGLEESYSVMKLGAEKNCIVANLLSERFGEEVNLFNAAERLALNIETAACL